MYKKVIGLVLVGMMSLSVVGCGNSEVEYQEPQVQQEQTVDNYNVLLDITKDLEYYNTLNEKCLSISESTDYNSRVGIENAYNEFYNLLHELRDYENCYETNELKGYLLNALTSAVEMLDYMYQGDVYRAEKALTEFQKYTEMYCRECENLTETYCSESI